MFLIRGAYRKTEIPPYRRGSVLILQPCDEQRCPKLRDQNLIIPYELETG